MSINKKIVAMLLPIASITFLQLPAMAALTNIRLGGLNQSDYDAYCASKINLSNGQIVATLADTHVRCQVSISATASTQADAAAAVMAAANQAGLRGSIGASAQYGSQWQATFTSQQNAYHLNQWCRQKYAPNGYFFNPINGEGRIFVAEGGSACHKTENR